MRAIYRFRAFQEMNLGDLSPLRDIPRHRIRPGIPCLPRRPPVEENEEKEFFLMICIEKTPWQIARLPVGPDNEANKRLVRIALDHSWLIIQEEDAPYGPRRFRGAMTTEDMRRQTLLASRWMMEQLTKEFIREKFAEAHILMNSPVLDE